MSNEFTAAVTPPDPHPENALAFAFKKDQLLTRLQDEQAQVPTLSDLAGLAHTDQHYLGVCPEHGHCYALELAEETKAPTGLAFHGLRDIAPKLGLTLFGIGGRAVQIVAWGQTHRYCGRCGSENVHAENERAQTCPCCGLMCFPRLSPAIIVRIERGDQILLARNHRFPAGLYSVLAGFVEPGETLEECVVREVREEVGIYVEDIRYFASQPWPFPNSLMLGFTARHKSGEIEVDNNELAEADWYRPNELPNLPLPLSIARRLIDDYLKKHGVL